MATYLLLIRKIISCLVAGLERKTPCMAQTEIEPRVCLLHVFNYIENFKLSNLFSRFSGKAFCRCKSTPNFE